MCRGKRTVITGRIQFHVRDAPSIVGRFVPAVWALAVTDERSRVPDLPTLRKGLPASIRARLHAAGHFTCDAVNAAVNDAFKEPARRPSW
jgi:hypothetical protein